MVSERKSVYADRTFYQKSGEKSYLVIRSGEEPELPYQINMIRYNKISGLLPIQFFIEDGEYQYFYDISGKESLAERMKQKKYSTREIRTVMSDLYRCVEQLEEYLLDTNCLILEPEYMFSEKNMLNIQFCFYQDQNKSFEKSLEELFEYFMNRLDYQDEKTVLLIYGLYQKSKEKRISLSELMKQFCDMQSPALEEGENRQSETVREFADRDMTFCGNEPEKEIIFSRKEMRFSKQKDLCKRMGVDKKYMMQRWIPYLPDIIGGYGIARILWYLGKNRMQMSGKAFMFWMFMVAGILAVCGILSTFLTGYLDKRLGEREEEGLKDQNVTISKQEDKGDDLNENINRYQNRMKWQPERTDDRHDRVKQQQNQKDMFDEFSFWDEAEIGVSGEKQQDVQINIGNDTAETNKNFVNSVPATVIMSEPELFRAFNPVLISKNKEKFQDILLKERTVVVGKVRGIADICLEGRGISRVHARISQDKKGCSVTDLGSTNGTFVNGIQLQERQRRYLEKGDEIRFAEAVYEFLPAETENARSHQISDVI